MMATPPTTETPIIRPVCPPLPLDSELALWVAEAAAAAVLVLLGCSTVEVTRTVDPAASVELETLAVGDAVTVDW